MLGEKKFGVFMADAKTVDNLGPEVHKRYIDDIKLLSEEDVKKIFQTPSVASRTEVLKTAPQLSEFDLLWGITQTETSPFEAPPNFAMTSDIFSYQLIPSFGPTNDIIEKLNSLDFKKKKKKKKKSPDEPDEDGEDDEDGEEENERERKNLLKFAMIMSDLNKIITEIKKRKDEYHKG
jgi:hypothetical protein